MARQLNKAKLVDVMTRYQAYLEGVKLQFGQSFEITIREIRKDFREIFFDVDAATLDGLTKRQLDQFIRKLVRAQNKHFSAYTAKLLADLREFMAASTEVHSEIMRDTQQSSKRQLAALLALLTASQQKKLWALVVTSPLPANGVSLEDSLLRFSDSAANTLIALIRKHAANKARPRDALLALIGTPTNALRDGQVTRYGYQAAALSATFVQHASNIVQAAVNAEYFDFYRWLSIIDSRTSEICRSRNDKIYGFGKGPLPPAHMNCRSHVEPVDPDDVDAPPASYGAWYANQPANVREDIGGDGATFKPREALTTKQFRNKLKFLLSA